MMILQKWLSLFQKIKSYKSLRKMCMENYKFISNVQWQVNSTCNLKCKHCFLSEPNVKNEEIDYKNAVKIVNLLKNSGIKKIDFTLREPLAYKNIYKLMEYCYKQNLGINLLTNGIVLNDEENVKKLFEVNLSTLNISLEGISEKTNDYTRGNGVFKKVITGVNLINKYRKKYNLYFPIIVHFTLSSINANESSKIPNFFNELGIDALTISEIDLKGEAKKNKYLKLNQNETNEAIEKIIHYYSKLEEKNFAVSTDTVSPIADLYFNLKYNLNIPINRPRCSVLSDNFIINSDNELCTCPKMLYGDFDAEKYADLIKYNIFNLDESKKFYNHISKFKKNIINIKNEYQYYACGECMFYEECVLCPFVNKDSKALANTSNMCGSYKNKLNKLIDEIINNLQRYNIRLKNTSSIAKNGSNYIFKNIYKLGVPYERNIILDVDEQHVIECILRKENSDIYFQIERLKEPKKFLKKIIFTDCIEFLERR